MRYLKETVNYSSLKMQYLEEQFPALGGRAEGCFGRMVENTDIEEVGDDSKESLLSDMNALKEKLIQAKAQIKLERKTATTAIRKLEHVEKVASQRILESMPGENFEEDSNHLTMLLATVQKHDDFDYDIKADTVEPKSSNFLKKIEDQCADIPDKEAKLSLVRNKVLDKMKRSVIRERRLSVGGSVTSGTTLGGSRAGSRTRQRSEGEESIGEVAPKQRRPSLSGKERLSRLPGPVQKSS